MSDYTLNPSYAQSSELNAYIANLPESFERSGILIWNGRNKIKAVDITINDVKRMVVKRFKRPNLIQKIGYIFRSHKARKSYQNGMEMIRRGINTPEPIAYVEIRKGLLLSDAYYLCKELTHCTEIREAFEKEEWDKDVAKALAHLFAQLHERGILHNDMNNTNILFSNEEGEIHFTLIDINRVTFHDSIHTIPMKERIENMTRFTGRYDLFQFIAKEYASACGIPNPEQWAKEALMQKKQHDRNWNRRKAITHPLRAISKSS